MNHNNANQTRTIEIIENEIWTNYFLSHSNPGLYECGVFLHTFLEDVDLKLGNVQVQTRLTDEHEIEIANLHAYFAKHSNPLFNELSEWLPQWFTFLEQKR
jgi:hypothetical protein